VLLVLATATSTCLSQPVGFFLYCKKEKHEPNYPLLTRLAGTPWLYCGRHRRLSSIILICINGIQKTNTGQPTCRPLLCSVHAGQGLFVVGAEQLRVDVPRQRHNCATLRAVTRRTAPQRLVPHLGGSDMWPTLPNGI
jgi:hypothetical protein